jgi:antitoxin StbD
MDILTSKISSISELKKNPMKVMASGDGEAVAILNHNKPAFYVVPVEAYAKHNSPLPNYNDEELKREIADRIRECEKHPESLLTMDDFKDIEKRLIAKLNEHSIYQKI